ncbi:uncharacterized protein LOC106053398 isoform X2 [Biomphalaria glabrata]|uniref:Uncharacterized protein LOC106053398 isoform X2 n=1 Tax=Biomphalaria glabrata TaxID=6526 RepID=A0A9W2YT42_BIOGL|nr:uncharacterized protein LOC106053398 isoform X2 [Biomphalaria glabrata]
MILNSLLFLFFFMNMDTVFSDSFFLECPPVQENAELIIKTSVSGNKVNKDSKMIFKFFTNDSKIYSCTVEHQQINCIYENRKIPNTIISNTRNISEDYYNISIILSSKIGWRNILHKSSSIQKWSVQLEPDSYKECDIKFYAIFDQPKCFTNISMEDFNITCVLKKVFPKAFCKFDVTLNYTEEIKGIVTYRHTEIENGDYYLSSCYFRSENPENGSYYVNVTMYPNITGTEGDIKYGKTSAFQTQDSYEKTTEITTEIVFATTSLNTTRKHEWFSDTDFTFLVILSCVVLLLITISIIVLFLIIKRKRVHSHLRANKGITYDSSGEVKTDIIKSSQPKRLNVGYVNCTNVTDSSDTHRRENNNPPQSGCRSPAKFKI